MNDQTLQGLLLIALEAALEAVGAIRAIYKQSVRIDLKQDGTPITDADRKANDIIMGYLTGSGLPVISEESPQVDFQDRRNWQWYWLVDPLDGTREFIDRTGEFTVNIALMHAANPIIGVIAAPVPDYAMVGWVGHKTWKIESASQIGQHHPHWRQSAIDDFARTVRMYTSQPGLSVAVSRSNYDEKTRGLVQKLSESYDRINLVSRGSSLKFCNMAENLISLYPRHSPTWEWDTAAGHAILRASGGELYTLDKQPLQYNKEKLINPPFIAIANPYESDRIFSELAL